MYEDGIFSADGFNRVSSRDTLKNKVVRYLIEMGASPFDAENFSKFSIAQAGEGKLLSLRGIWLQLSPFLKLLTFEVYQLKYVYIWYKNIFTLSILQSAGIICILIRILLLYINVMEICCFEAIVYCGILDDRGSGYIIRMQSPWAMSLFDGAHYFFGSPDNQELFIVTDSKELSFDNTGFSKFPQGNSNNQFIVPLTDEDKEKLQPYVASKRIRCDANNTQSKSTIFKDLEELKVIGITDAYASKETVEYHRVKIFHSTGETGPIKRRNIRFILEDFFKTRAHIDSSIATISSNTGFKYDPEIISDRLYNEKLLTFGYNTPVPNPDDLEGYLR